MKLGFSTLGCPRWSFNDVIITAKDLGYDGIEIRGISDEMYAPKIKVFNQIKLADTIKRLGKLEIPILTSNSCIAVYGEAEKAINEAIDYINLASKLNVKFIRIMCTNSPYVEVGDYAQAVKAYKTICEYASSFNVTPLIETNGMFCDSNLLVRFMIDVNMSNSGVLWDVHHPYRFGGESIDFTLSNIGKYVKYVHLKDSFVAKGGTHYRLIGLGDIPIKYAIDKLKEIDYDGYLTLEWVKRWNPDLQEPGIVFSHYIDCVRKLI